MNIGSHTSSAITSPCRQVMVRTSRWSASWSVGGRVWRASVSSSSTQSPIVSASWTTAQPLRVIQVVSSTSEPGT
jgi:hypothetical protein